MKGIICVNPFGIPKESLFQAKRLKEEFDLLGVITEIISDGYARNFLLNGEIKRFTDCDFAVFLDKDKYLSACLEKTGVKLFNSHSAIRICDDKGETCTALANHGIKIPDTVFAPVCYSEQ